MQQAINHAGMESPKDSSNKGRFINETKLHSFLAGFRQAIEFLKSEEFNTMCENGADPVEFLESKL